MWIYKTATTVHVLLNKTINTLTANAPDDKKENKAFGAQFIL